MIDVIILVSLVLVFLFLAVSDNVQAKKSKQLFEEEARYRELTRAYEELPAPAKVRRIYEREKHAVYPLP